MSEKNANIFSNEETFFGNPLFRLASSTVVLLLITVIFGGWLLGKAAFVSILPQWPAVAPLTAMCFFMTALATLLLGNGRLNPKSIKGCLLMILLGVVATFSLLIVVRGLFGWSIPIDMLFFEKTGDLIQLKYTPETAPATAVCFLLTVAHLYFVWFRRSFSFLRILLSILVLFQTSLILIAYIYSANLIFEFPFFLKMSVLTAFMFLILNLGLIISSPRRSESWLSLKELSLLSQDIAREKVLYYGILLVFLIFLAIGILASNSLDGMRSSFIAVRESQKKVYSLEELMLHLVNAESGQRGFLLTGDESYLEHFRASENEMKSTRTFLATWVKDHPQHREWVEQIEKVTDEKVKEMKQTIELRKSKGFAAAQAVVQTHYGQQAMNQIREMLSKIQQDQENVLAKSERESGVKTKKTVTIIMLGSLLAVFLMVVCLGLYLKNSLRRQAAEEYIRKLNSTLEGKLHELEVANKELESFSYSVSHDLRAPLRAMSGFSNILLEDYHSQLNEEAQGYLKRIITASDKMSQLINGILDISRISRKQLHKVPLSLSRMASQIVDDLHRTEPERKVEVKIDPDMQAVADADLLTTTLQNLLGNAWKFTSKNEVAHIQFGKTKKENKDIFYIKDDGAGFDMQYSEKLFGTFQRLHTEKEFQGTGVGLASVRRVIHLHGGDVWAEGKTGNGATFYFTLGS